MHILYTDEAGCLGMLPTNTFPIQPVFAVGGIILDQQVLEEFTWNFLNLKREFFPGKAPPSGEGLDWI
jgi:hypothetical protein